MTPEQALASAQQALLQLQQADVRGDGGSDVDTLGDALAQGTGVGNSAALQQALADGLSPAEALARANALAAALAAQQDAANVAQSDANKAETGLGQGNLGALGKNADASTAARLLASGANSADALAAAQKAAALKAQMQSESAVDLSAPSSEAADLAQGGGNAQDPLLAALLAQGLSPELAAQLVSQAQAERKNALANAEAPVGDQLTLDLAQGTVPAGYILVMEGGTPRLVQDRSAEQRRAAITVAGDELALAMANGALPDALRQELADVPGLSNFLIAELNSGEDFNTALETARKLARRKFAEEARAVAAFVGDLDQRLATGRVDDPYLLTLAGATPQDFFRPVFGFALESGAAPTQALHEAHGALPTNPAPPPSPPAQNEDVRTTQ